jgi:hypothetical protein
MAARPFSEEPFPVDRGMPYLNQKFAYPGGREGEGNRQPNGIKPVVTEVEGFILTKAVEGEREDFKRKMFRAGLVPDFLFKVLFGE